MMQRAPSPRYLWVNFHDLTKAKRFLQL